VFKAYTVVKIICEIKHRIKYNQALNLLSQVNTLMRETSFVSSLVSFQEDEREYSYSVISAEQTCKKKYYCVIIDYHTFVSPVKRHLRYLHSL
jgi:hypothetical protein